MQKFLVGFVSDLLVTLLLGFLFLRLGFVNPRADVPVGALEKYVAMPSLDASVDRRAPEIRNPLQGTDADLIAGMKLYQANCTSCHGDVRQPDGLFPKALYPRPPLFVRDAPDMPQNQNFYIIEHGIRLSAMPAWRSVLNGQQGGRSQPSSVTWTNCRRRSQRNGRLWPRQRCEPFIEIVSNCGKKR